MKFFLRKGLAISGLTILALAGIATAGCAPTAPTPPPSPVIVTPPAPTKADEVAAQLTGGGFIVVKGSVKPSRKNAEAPWLAMIKLEQCLKAASFLVDIVKDTKKKGSRPGIFVPGRSSGEADRILTEPPDDDRVANLGLCSGTS